MLLGCNQKAEPPAGTERGACYGNGTCNEGLLCLSDLCVRPPPADCQKVAEKLGFLLLGNYAKPAERDAFKSEHVTVCEQAMLSKEDGDCILKAKNRRALAQCPKPIALGDCNKIIDHMAQLASGDTPKIEGLVSGDRERMRRECQRQGISKAQEACILKGKTLDDLKACGPF